MSGKEDGAGRSWYRRRAVVFSLAVAVLGAGLIALAWWESDRERLAWERQQSRDLEKGAGLVAGKILSLLTDLMTELSRSSRGGLPGSPGSSPPERPPASESFIVHPNGQVMFLSFSWPYRPGNSGPSLGTAVVAGKPEGFRDAEFLEFVKKDLAAVVPAYRAALASASTPMQRGWTMNALARALVKSGRSEEALAVYRDLLRDFSAVRSEGGLPLGLVGGFASAQVEASLEKLGAAARTLFGIREELLRGAFDLDKSQFTYFLGLAGERSAGLIQRLRPGEVQQRLASRHKALLLDEARVLERAERAEIIARNPAAYRTAKITFSILPIPSLRYLVGALPLASGETWGAIMDADELAAQLVPEAVRSLAMGETLHAGLVTGGLLRGRAASSPASPDLPGSSFERPLAPHLSQWTIRTWYRPGWRSPRFGLRRAIYIGAALALAALILVSGLVTIRSLAREMELVRLKTDFVATVSHELRTPLTSIRYISELLKDGRVGEESRRAQYFATLYQESERLSRIIENILDVSKMDAGLKQYQFSWVDAGPFTAEIAKRFQEAVSPKGWALETGIPVALPALWIDPEAIGRALFNLLDNAVKYSGESRRVELEAACDDREFRWKITDHGLGILEGDRSRIFDRFYRGSYESGPEIKGSGIGLAIAKHIVEAHGGTISVDSEVGRGSTFTIAIPLAMGKADTTPRPERTR